MGKPTGFLEKTRIERSYRDNRTGDWSPFLVALSREQLETNNAAICMDCAVPFCSLPVPDNKTGCGLGNQIYKFNDAIFRGNWDLALQTIDQTNNFPEFTGEICPAPCEGGCTLAMYDTAHDIRAVNIKTNEAAIAAWGWEQGQIRPKIAETKTGKNVAVVGSGPAGLALAQDLARIGHNVFVFEKNGAFGGLLRYGIPHFKMAKSLIDRRIEQMQAEGVRFIPHTEVGVDLSMAELDEKFDAVAFTVGAEAPNDLPAPGRGLGGIHFAMEFLSQQSKRNSGEPFTEANILATNKDVVVIGGGDTGSDCIGTATRQGAKSVTQIEIMPQLPLDLNRFDVWPRWADIFRRTSSHYERPDMDRRWQVGTREFIGRQGRVEKILCESVDVQRDVTGRPNFVPIADSGFELKADLVLLAMGFRGPRPDLFKAHGLELVGNKVPSSLNADGTVNHNVTGMGPKFFSAGDARRGQSLVKWAIREGKDCARQIDRFLAGDRRAAYWARAASALRAA